MTGFVCGIICSMTHTHVWPFKVVNGASGHANDFVISRVLIWPTIYCDHRNRLSCPAVVLLTTSNSGSINSLLKSAAWDKACSPEQTIMYVRSDYVTALLLPISEGLMSIPAFDGMSLWPPATTQSWSGPTTSAWRTHRRTPSPPPVTNCHAERTPSPLPIAWRN